MNMSPFIYLILSPAENVICPLLSALYVPLVQSSSLFTGHEKNCSLDMALWPFPACKKSSPLYLLGKLLLIL